MEDVVAVLIAIAAIGFVVGLLGLASEKLKNHAQKLAIGSVLLLVGAAATYHFQFDNWARAQGYDDGLDRRAARAAKIETAEAWSAEKAKAKEAGFNNYFEWRDAQKLGFSTAKEMADQAEANRKAAEAAKAGQPVSQ